MARVKVQDQIEKRIIEASYGCVFVPSDFFDIASPGIVNMALKRLAEKKTLRKVMRGIYDKPLFSDLLQEYQVPSIEKVAEAIARNYHWTIVPSGGTALNLLGLSTQVAAQWTYNSDGPYKLYRIGNIELRFNHTSQKKISHLSPYSALIIQAINALGKDALQSPETIEQFSRLLLDDKAKQTLLQEAQHTTAWIFSAIQKMCSNGENNHENCSMSIQLGKGNPV